MQLTMLFAGIYFVWVRHTQQKMNGYGLIDRALLMVTKLSAATRRQLERVAGFRVAFMVVMLSRF
jgi:hypothetical protein